MTFTFIRDRRSGMLHQGLTIDDGLPLETLCGHKVQSPTDNWRIEDTIQEGEYICSDCAKEKRRLVNDSGI